MVTALMAIQLLVSLSLIVVVSLQESKGEGLGSIGGGSQMFFGKVKGLDQILERVTKYLAVAFMLLSLILTFI
ncbi:MAG: preprotein translocase subunit SecG [Firmicutes bacterium]|jgi:preprotein translocase subunit SecG|nr:preprotein translocase subunit SecG [Bacillota bacterium]